MPWGHSRDIVGDCARFFHNLFHLTFWHKEKFRFRANETADKPGTRNAVYGWPGNCSDEGDFGPAAGAEFGKGGRVKASRMSVELKLGKQDAKAP